MKNFQKILQNCHKLEESSIRRRTKDIDDSTQFDQQKETAKCRQLEQHLKVDSAYAKRQLKELDIPVELEQEALHEHAAHLDEIEAFDQQATAYQLDGAHNAFETIAEIQGFSFSDDDSHALKQLPAGPADAFHHELHDLTDMELQRETDKNDAAIHGEQEEEPEEAPHEPETPFFFRPVPEKE